ncbi:hypothetical protein DPEC_G00093930 [Dallia pectoralis]|uniref:Uncharacterized protein n=1 Tax=Dallia pectoralis TaxID=75939 RepID=A0ACC2H1P1_DALPE|nr:hypothetical protein DPEC_G00093930 [Dallia pectoralis]
MCSPEIILEHILWPLEEEDEDDEYSVDIKCRIAGYLRQFIETASTDNLKQLVKFWVGWEIPMRDMQLEVVKGDFPKSSTCFLTLRMPGHYKCYQEFSSCLLSCIATNDTGFGLV